MAIQQASVFKRNTSWTIGDSSLSSFGGREKIPEQVGSWAEQYAGVVSTFVKVDKGECLTVGLSSKNTVVE